MDTNKHKLGESAEERRLTTKDEMTDFLLYTAPDGQVKVECILHYETIWLAQKRIAELFGVGVPAISKHLDNIYADGELAREATVSVLETVQQEGSRQVERKLEFYNPDNRGQTYAFDKTDPLRG